MIDEAEMLRAQAYALLGGLLARPPCGQLVQRCAALTGDGSHLGQALARLGEAARTIPVEEARREYDALFIGVTRGELVPYASYYLTGFLNERPLAILREDMRRLGIGSSEARSDPEDHIASLCEMMAGLIGGAFGEPLPLGQQQRFFDRHLARWAARFFADLAAAKSAVFYKPLGEAGRLFMDVEAEAFAMAA